MSSIVLLILKIISGIILGLTFATIIQILIDTGVLSMIFIMITTATAFIKLTWYLKYKGLIVINLVFISLFFLFKLYISIAAG